MKTIASMIAAVIAMVYICLSKVFGFWNVSVWVGHIPTQVGDMIRKAFYRRTLNCADPSAHFVFGCNFSYPDVSVGGCVRIGYGTTVGLVDIGDDTRIGAYCCLLSGSGMHGIERTDIPIRLQPGKLERITIGRDCWLGAHVVVMADIGEGSVIGAGAVVTKPIPPWSVAVGNPAKVIRSRKEHSETPTPDEAT